MDEWNLDTQPAASPPEKHAAPIAPGVSETPVEAQAPGAPLSFANGPTGSPLRRLWRRRKRVLLAWAGVGLVLLLAGALVGFYVSDSQAGDRAAQLVEAQKELGLVQKALSQAEERNWNYYRENETLSAQLEAAQSQGTSTTSTTISPSGSPKTYRDGVYLVGEDILPGTYDGVVTDSVGYWARLRGTDGVVGSIVANALPRGPFVLTIVESDTAVELQGVELTAR